MHNALASNEYLLQPGYLYMTQRPHVIYSVLGSCVMVSLWDRHTGAAGTCHYRYPYTSDRGRTTPEYGNAALTGLITMMTKHGAHRHDLEAMIFGGASRDDADETGSMNVRIARRILKQRRIRIVSEDTEGLLGRKVIFHTATNQAVIYKIRKLRDADWYPYSGS